MHNLFPLIATGVNSARGKKEFLIVAGVSDDIFTVDAETGSQLWRKHSDNTRPPGGNGRSGGTLCPDGQTAVPVIGNAGSGKYTVYAVSWDGRLWQPNAADDGKVALVTGGYGGIGGAISRGLAEMGATIAVTGHDGEKTAAFATVLQELGADVLGAAFDVLSVADTERMADQVANHFGRLDILVNCVGLNREEKAGEVTEADFDHVLAAEWGPHQINVNVVAPTCVQTQQVAHTFADPVFYNALVARIPLGRIASLDDVKNAVLFFVSSASDLVTGQTLYIEGVITATQ
jgi:NAD(P)-dependent dehydrogenase (short-subunit alcohol dehydrogenase family)